MLPFFFISLQVVNALTDISEGNTCHIGSGDYSPTRSHSCYSDSDFDESEDEMQGPLECEGEIQSLSSECIASNSISQMIVRQPPSPPIQSISSSGSSSFEFYDESTSDCGAQNEGNIIEI